MSGILAKRINDKELITEELVNEEARTNPHQTISYLKIMIQLGYKWDSSKRVYKR